MNRKGGIRLFDTSSTLRDETAAAVGPASRPADWAEPGSVLVKVAEDPCRACQHGSDGHASCTLY